jgi:glucokinase
MDNVKGSLELIKRMNRSLVLETVKTCQPISRAQVAKKLKLSKTTVVAIVNDLVERKLLTELGEGTSSKGGGRPGMMLGFNPKSAYGIGVDIGGTKIQVIITDLVGEIVLEKKIETTNQIDELVSMIKDCIQEANISAEKVIGMGIGVPGTTRNGTVILAKSLGWQNLALETILKSQFHFPIFVKNDVQYALMGERWLGSGDNSDNIFFIAIGTGIGSAIICDGNLVTGQQNRAGEICYQTSKDDFTNGRVNIQGRSSVFEEKVSGSSLSRHNYPPEELFKLYSGKSEVVPIIKDFVLDLSVVIANVVSLLNPEFVIIGGGVSDSMGVVINEIQELVSELTPTQTQVRLATLGGQAGALGAIAYTFERVEQS